MNQPLKRSKPSNPLEASGCLSVFGLLWPVASIIFLIAGFGFLIQDRSIYNRLSREGVTANATITHLEMNGSGDSASYSVHYQFTAPVKGSTIQLAGYESVSSSFYSTHASGQTIEILYAVSEPTLTAVKTEFGPLDVLWPGIFIGIGGLLALMGIATMYSGVKRVSRLQSAPQPPC